MRPDPPNDDPVPDFHECQGKGYEKFEAKKYIDQAEFQDCGHGHAFLQIQ